MSTVADVRSELHETIEQIFAPARLVSAEPHPLRSSCDLVRVELDGPDGSVRLIMKNLGWHSRHPMPAFLRDPEREIEVYEKWLPAAGIRAAAFAGAEVDSAYDRYWLFLEEVEGIPLWQAGGWEPWSAAATWLAALHSVHAPAGRRTLCYDAAYYAPWLARAARLHPGADLERIAPVYAHAIERLLAAPCTFIHGDCYPSNILVRTAPHRGICPVDFELAGSGPAVLDLAALVTGLPAAHARDLVSAYAAASRSNPCRDELDELLLCARLHLAVRWLGWLPGWQPPEHQRFDWAHEAHSAARALGV